MTRILFIAAVLALQTPLLLADIPIKRIAYGIGETTPDLAFDLNDEFVVVYRDGLPESLNIVRGSDCSTQETVVDQSLGQLGFSPTVKIDSVGLPHIVHGAFGNPTGLYYTLLGGPLFGQLSNNVIQLSPSFFAADFELDSLDRPYVVARGNGDNPFIPVLHWFNIQTGLWENSPIPTPTPNWGQGQSAIPIAINQNDEPVVAMGIISRSQGDIGVATLSTRGWTFRIHSPINRGQTRGSLAVTTDDTDAPIVAASTSSGLWVLRFGLIGVTEQLVTAAAETRIGPRSLVSLPGGRLRLAYQADTDNGSAIFVASNDFGWSSQLIEESIEDREWLPAIAVDSWGSWAISYAGESSSHIRVAGPNIRGGRLGDVDEDLILTMADFDLLSGCLAGPEIITAPIGCDSVSFDYSDLDCDQDGDITDLSILQMLFNQSEF